MSEIDCVDEISNKAWGIKFYCPSETTRIRSKVAQTREIETQEWINTFNKDETFWDIGANFGVYSLYAAKIRNVNTVAFELLPWNHSILIKNVTLNGLNDKIQAFNIGISDCVESVQVNIPAVADTAGGAGGQIGSMVDAYGRPFSPLYTMTALTFTVDQLVLIPGISFPNHIKMDIDGNEIKAVAGMEKTLADQRLRSLMFELQPESSAEIVKIVQSYGFQLTQHCSSVSGASFDPDVGSGNYFFLRSS